MRLPFVRAFALVSFLLLLAFAFGCKKKSPPPTGGASAGASGDLIASGKAVFDRNGCAQCHAIGGMGGRSAPDLSKVGAATGRTAEWLVAHVRNPKSHNPMSRMPSFEGKINDKDLLALGAYLASLK